jgi:hypothetical protein
MRIRCDLCDGFGHRNVWETVSDGMAECKKIPCTACGGKGFTEHVVFSIEEALAILEHVGLSKED